VVILFAQVIAQLYNNIVCAEAQASPERFADQSFPTIAVDCTRRGFAACDHPEARTRERIGARSHDEVVANDFYSVAQHRLELAALAQHVGPSGDPSLIQTARRARPLARRALSTARPALVFMRTRKPCVRLRRVLEG
jgi:hypothetical protein